MDTLAFADIARVDAVDKVCGKPLYAADDVRPGMLHGVMAVATVNRGEVRNILTHKARAVRGVRLIVTHHDMQQYRHPGYLLAGGFAFQSVQAMLSATIAYRGQPIALIVADTIEAAAEAAGLIEATYSTLPSQVSLDAPVKDIVPQHGSPLPQALFGDKLAGDAQAALATAVIRIDAHYATFAQHHNPIELIATVAEWRKGTLIIHEGTQNSGAVRGGLARMMGLDPACIVVISPHTGGAFGQKNSLQMQTLLAAHAARALGKPVKIVTPRAQLFHAASFRPATRHHIRLGAQADGKVIAAHHEVDQQTSRHDLFPATCTELTARLYGIPNFLGQERLVRTDVQTPGFMRAPWEHAGAFAFESAMDELAYAARLDPVELRQLNDTQQDVLTGKPLSSRFMNECIRRGAEQFGWAKRSAAPGSMRLRDGTQVGWGMACGAYKAASAPAIATIEATDSGRIRVSVAGHEMGQGIRTAIANLILTRLHVPLASIEIVIGDTRGAPQHVTAGSWGTATAIPAVDEAVQALLAELAPLRPAGGDAMTPAQILKHAGRARIATEIRRKAEGQADAVFQRLAGGLAAAQGPVHASFVAMSYVAHFVEVHVEPRTRRIRVARVVSVVDCGRVVSPRTALSQVKGGVIWGIGSALREISEVDPRFGGFLNADLAEYLVPVNADIAAIQASFVDQPDPLLNALGVKGLGEVAMVGVAPAIANAVYHATGKRVRSLPIRIDDVM